MKRTLFIVVGLGGANEASFSTRENARILADIWNSQTDMMGQDLEDRALCARYGLPFMPRRYFVTTETEAFSR
jgi:hypothetical protein